MTCTNIADSELRIPLRGPRGGPQRAHSSLAMAEASRVHREVLPTRASSLRTPRPAWLRLQTRLLGSLTRVLNVAGTAALENGLVRPARDWVCAGWSDGALCAILAASRQDRHTGGPESEGISHFGAAFGSWGSMTIVSSPVFPDPE